MIYGVIYSNIHLNLLIQFPVYCVQKGGRDKSGALFV